MKNNFLILEGKFGKSNFVIIPYNASNSFSDREIYRKVGEMDTDSFQKFGIPIVNKKGIEIYVLGGLITSTSKDAYINLKYDSIEASFTDASLYLGKFIHHLHGRPRIMQSAYITSNKEKLELQKTRQGYCLMLNNQRLKKRESDGFEYGVFDYLVRGGHFKGNFSLEKIADLHNVRKRSLISWERKTTISFY